MEGIFIKLLNLSIQASILITVVLLLRFILNKSPKSIKCLLWALVAIRLVCPFSIESKFSLAPDAEVVSMDNYVGMPNVLSKTTGSDRYVKGYAESYDHEVVTVEKKNTDPLHIFSIIWLGGVVILAVYALGSCLKIWRSGCPPGSFPHGPRRTPSRKTPAVPVWKAVRYGPLPGGSPRCCW